jgi:hypothetical protein
MFFSHARDELPVQLAANVLPDLVLGIQFLGRFKKGKERQEVVLFEMGKQCTQGIWRVSCGGFLTFGNGDDDLRRAARRRG